SSPSHPESVSTSPHPFRRSLTAAAEGRNERDAFAIVGARLVAALVMVIPAAGCRRCLVRHRTVRTLPPAEPHPSRRGTRDEVRHSTTTLDIRQVPPATRGSGGGSSRRTPDRRHAM